MRNKEKEMEFGLAYIYKEYIEKQFFYLASVKSWSVSYSRERAHALGHLYNHWSEDVEENKDIQVLFKRSKEIIKVESLEIYKIKYAYYVYRFFRFVYFMCNMLCMNESN